MFKDTVEEFEEAFNGFEDDIAGEPVTDHHIDISGEDVPTLHIPDKVEERAFLIRRWARTEALGHPVRKTRRKKEDLFEQKDAKKAKRI